MDIDEITNSRKCSFSEQDIGHNSTLKKFSEENPAPSSSLNNQKSEHSGKEVSTFDL